MIATLRFKLIQVYDAKDPKWFQIAEDYLVICIYCFCRLLRKLIAIHPVVKLSSFSMTEDHNFIFRWVYCYPSVTFICMLEQCCQASCCSWYNLCQPTRLVKDSPLWKYCRGNKPSPHREQVFFYFSFSPPPPQHGQWVEAEAGNRILGWVHVHSNRTDCTFTNNKVCDVKAGAY